MMQSRHFILSLISLSFSWSVWAATPVGPEGSVVDWTGTYQITKCITCPDAKLPNGFNVKDFKRFMINSGEYDKADLPSCAQTSQWTMFGFVLQAPDNSSNMVARGTSPCDWTDNEVLIATPDIFYYVDRGLTSGHKLTISIMRIGDGNRFEIYKHESSPRPAFGFPTDWEYRAEAVKN